MSADEVARAAGVSKRRVCQVCQQGGMEATKVATIWLIDRQSALAWIGGNRQIKERRKRYARR